MWFALVVLFFGGLWAVAPPVLRKERENNNTKQTSFNQRKGKKVSELIAGGEERQFNWNEMEVEWSGPAGNQ